MGNCWAATLAEQLGACLFACALEDSQAREIAEIVEKIWAVSYQQGMHDMAVILRKTAVEKNIPAEIRQE